MSNFLKIYSEVLLILNDDIEKMIAITTWISSYAA